MSKIGKKPIEVPKGVDIIKNGNELKIKGSLGENVFQLPKEIKMETHNNQIIFSIEKENKFTKAMWGTTRALLANKIIGVSRGFQKDLIIEGLGYSTEVSGNQISLKIGYNHPVFLTIPDNVKVEAKPQRGFYLISITGIDKDDVGRFAGKIRNLKKAEPYKGKGIRYSDEKIKRKSVKKLGA